MIPPKAHRRYRCERDPAETESCVKHVDENQGHIEPADNRHRLQRLFDPIGRAQHGVRVDEEVVQRETEGIHPHEGHAGVLQLGRDVRDGDDVRGKDPAKDGEHDPPARTARLDEDIASVSLS